MTDSFLDFLNQTISDYIDCGYHSFNTRIEKWQVIFF